MQDVTVQTPTTAQLTKELVGLVEVKSLSITFGCRERPTKVLDNINFQVEPGSFICLLGPSGCGKSTLLNLIAGFIRPTTGCISVDRQAVTKPGAERGFVFQQYSLLPWKTTAQNVEFGLRIKGMAKKQRRELVDEYLYRVGLYKHRNSYPHQLSGGMKQRASIIRALVNSPSVLLMDEPFGALDAQTRHMMQELLMEIWSDLKTTVVFVTHDIEEAVFLSDRILILGINPGHLKEDILVDFKRPRHIDDTMTLEFAQLSRQVFEVIREETLKSMER